MVNENLPNDPLSKLQRDVEQIKDALLGTEYTDKLGLVKRMSVMESKVSKIEIKIATYVGIGLGAIWLVDHFFKNL